MKVYYPGPGHETYHPQLGRLVPNEPFELDGKIARPYLDSGLLKQVEKKIKSAADKHRSTQITVPINRDEYL